MPKAEKPEKEQQPEGEKEDRTISLIDSFLQSIPEDEEAEKEEQKKKKRKPTPADAAIDYVSYLLETESEEEKEEDLHAPQMKGQNLIDNEAGKKIKLKDEPEYTPEIEISPESEKDSNEGYFTETLAKIYIKQGRYEKALEIIQRLNKSHPQQNAYFADQSRFLEKLILNNKSSKS